MKDISSTIVSGVAGLNMLALTAHRSLDVFIEAAGGGLIRSGRSRRMDGATLVVDSGRSKRGTAIGWESVR